FAPPRESRSRCMAREYARPTAQRGTRYLDPQNRVSGQVRPSPTQSNLRIVRAFAEGPGLAHGNRLERNAFRVPIPHWAPPAPAGFRGTDFGKFPKFFGDSRCINADAPVKNRVLPLFRGPSRNGSAH